MNLQRITAGAVGAVNRPVAGALFLSTGYNTDPDGTQVPQYADPVIVGAQVQALTGKDLKQIDGLNIQGVKRAIYLQGNVRGVSTAQGSGGDMISFHSSAIGQLMIGGGAINVWPLPGPDLLDTKWLVITVLETWNGWCKVGVVLQVDQP